MQSNNSFTVSAPNRYLAPRCILLRAAVLAPLALTVWWFLLKGVSLWLLRYLAFVPLGLLIAPSGYPPVRVDPKTGDWLFNVAVNADARDLKTGERQRVDSVEFAADPENVAFFACGWFSYLALAFSAQAFRRGQATRVLTGICLQTGIGILCLVAYVYVNGYGSVINTPGNSGLSMWLLKYVYHIIYLVVPFAGPFLVALLVHPEWREYFAQHTRKAPGSQRPKPATETARKRRLFDKPQAS